MKNEQNIFLIHTVEEKFITGNHLVQVTFQLPYHCWCKLLKKKFWNKVQKFLLEEERKHNQLLRQNQIRKEESSWQEKKK